MTIGEERIERRVERADRDRVAARQDARDDRVGHRGGGRRMRDAAGGQDDDPVVDRAEDEAACEPEAVDEPIEHEVRLADRVRHVIEARADVDQRLQVGPALSELSLVHRREDRRGEGEQPERDQVEDRHLLEFDGLAGHDIDRRHQLRGLRIEHDQQQQRVPQGELQAGAIRGQQRDGDQMQIDQEADGAAHAAGQVHRADEVDAIGEQETRDDR